MNKTLVLYAPHEVQLRFHNSKARYKVAATGRQFGKSTMANNELISKAWTSPGTQYAFVSPIFSQSREQYRRAIKGLPKEVLARKSDTELRLDFINGSSIEYLSGDNPDSLRGKTLHGVVVDEVRDQSQDLWGMILRPMLATTNGFAIFVSTPAGFDSFYDLFETATNDSTGSWEAFSGPSTCNPFFSQAEFEAARSEMTEAVFAQEILAEFRDLTSGKAYLTNGAHNHRTTSPFTRDGSLISPHLPIVVGMDFNVTPISWVLGQTNGLNFYWFDEIYLENSHTQEASIELIEKVKDHKAGVTICGDASGNAMKTSAVGRSDYAIIEQMLTDAGIRWENITPASNPSVKDRVNTVNMRLKNAQGETSMWYHPEKCKHLKRDLERVVWKVGASAILDQHKDPSLTHMSDAMGYPVAELTKVWEPSPGVLRIIRR